MRELGVGLQVLQRSNEFGKEGAEKGKGVKWIVEIQIGDGDRGSDTHDEGIKRDEIVLCDALTRN